MGRSTGVPRVTEFHLDPVSGALGGCRRQPTPQRAYTHAQLARRRAESRIHPPSVTKYGKEHSLRDESPSAHTFQASLARFNVISQELGGGAERGLSNLRLRLRTRLSPVPWVDGISRLDCGIADRSHARSRKRSESKRRQAHRRSAVHLGKAKTP